MGRAVRVRDSLADFLLVCRILEDEGVSDADRFTLLMYELYANPQGVCDATGDEVLAFLAETLWECFGIDTDGSHYTDGKRVIDWDEDHDYVLATARAAYGMGFEEFSLLPYKECCTLIGLAPDETPMGRAIHYRTCDPPKETKYNKEQVKAFKRAKKAWALKGRKQARPEGNAQQQKAAAQFAALSALARRGATHG